MFRVFFPIRPMLAGKLSSSQISSMVKRAGSVLVETKFDGERIQCHV